MAASSLKYAQRSRNRSLYLERLEDRLVLNGSPLPTTISQAFTVDDFNSTVTQTDLGFNQFGGNTGTINNPNPADSGVTIVETSLSSDSAGTPGNSLRMTFDFADLNPSNGPFAGIFASLFGLTDTKVVLQPGQSEPDDSTQFSDYFLDFDDIYGGFAPSELGQRSLEQIAFEIRLDGDTAPVMLKIELKDESGFDIFTRRQVNSTSWQTIVISRAQFNRTLRGDDTGQTVEAFDWSKVSIMSLIVERFHKADGVDNPNDGVLLIDNIRLVDSDGEYPDLAAAADPEDGTLLPQYEEAFLEYVHALSSLYFVDFASRDTTFDGNAVTAGGIIQDRSTFADLMSVGGVGFQLTSYVIDSERGYVSRAESADRVHQVLQTLHDGPQGAAPSETVGYEGFFYHFLGIDGRRKQNFDFQDTAVDESSNTVELSTIDTALALAGIITARQYFDGADPVEAEIRAWADAIYESVDWEFMLYRNPVDANDPQNYQFYLGWKPNEDRDDSGRFGRFQLNDDDGLGQYSSKVDKGIERPATLDFYTDEAILIALLAYEPLNAIEPGLGQKAWDAIERVIGSDGFVQTFPGALFTHQFFSLWVDTAELGHDNHPVPFDLFENTQAAVDATVDYTSENSTMRATWENDLGADLFGLSAAEGPFDDYFAYAAPPVALGDGRLCFGPEGLLQVESGVGNGVVMGRSNASNAQTVLLHQGQSRSLSLNASANTPYKVFVAYSNDGAADTIEVAVDDVVVGTFQTVDTRLSGGVPGSGWNVFAASEPIEVGTLSEGEHDLELRVLASDQFGVELDAVTILVPLEDGTVTNYGAASSIVHRPENAIAGLWSSARLKTEDSAYPELLHPRFGFADAFNLDVADAAILGCFDPARVVRGNVTSEAELGSGDGMPQARSSAFNNQTVLLHESETRTTSISITDSIPYYLSVRYSNDGASDTIRIEVDGEFVNEFVTADTRPAGGEPGSGWNVFATGGLVNLGTLSPGEHDVQITVTEADQFGVEIDAVLLVAPSGPWANFNGFAIDHGPTAIMIDNYLEDNFVPRQFMSHPLVEAAINNIFHSADYNSDGRVNAADYVVWRNTEGSTTELQADGNHDQVIDEQDYNVWRANFGESVPTPGVDNSHLSGTGNSVPGRQSLPNLPTNVELPDGRATASDFQSTSSIESSRSGGALLQRHVADGEVETDPVVGAVSSRESSSQRTIPVTDFIALRAGFNHVNSKSRHHGFKVVHEAKDQVSQVRQIALADTIVLDLIVLRTQLRRTLDASVSPPNDGKVDDATGDEVFAQLGDLVFDITDEIDESIAS